MPKKTEPPLTARGDTPFDKPGLKKRAVVHLNSGERLVVEDYSRVSSRATDGGIVAFLAVLDSQGFGIVVGADALSHIVISEETPE